MIPAVKTIQRHGGAGCVSCRGKDHATGYGETPQKVDDSGNWNGDWSGNNKQFTFALSEVTEDEYISTLNSKDDAHSEVLAFDDLINLFKSVEFPFEPKHLTEGFIDTLDYQHYFNEDEEFMSGWGFHELTPGYHVSTSFGHLLLVPFLELFLL